MPDWPTASDLFRGSMHAGPWLGLLLHVLTVALYRRGRLVATRGACIVLGVGMTINFWGLGLSSVQLLSTRGLDMAAIAYGVLAFPWVWWLTFAPLCVFFPIARALLGHRPGPHPRTAPRMMCLLAASVLLPVQPFFWFSCSAVQLAARASASHPEPR